MTEMTPITGPARPPCLAPARRARLGIVVGEDVAALRALPDDIPGWIVADDPYSALVMLLDDPTEWQVLVLDAGVFTCHRTAREFLRILEHEGLSLPVLVMNAPEELALPRLGEDLPMPRGVRRSAVFATP